MTLFAEFRSSIDKDDSFESDGVFITELNQVASVGTRRFLIKTKGSNSFCPPFIPFWALRSLFPTALFHRYTF